MFPRFGWLMVVGPTVVMAVLLLLRPRKKQQSRSPGPTRTGGHKPTLDLGGMALVEVLRRLDEAISKLEEMPQGPDNKELSDAVVVMARSGLSAYTQSMEWRKAMSLPLDPIASKSLSENLLDAMKLLEIGSDQWNELRSELDTFHSYVLGVLTGPAPESVVIRSSGVIPTASGGTGFGGSSPPPPIASA